MKCAAWLNNCFSFEFGWFRLVWKFRWRQFIFPFSWYFFRLANGSAVKWQKKSTGKNFEITTGLLLAAINNNVRLRMSQKNNHSFHFGVPRVGSHFVFCSSSSENVIELSHVCRMFLFEYVCRVYFDIINIPKYFRYMLALTWTHLLRFSTHSQIRIFMDLTYRIITHVSETIDLCVCVCL